MGMVSITSYADAWTKSKLRPMLQEDIACKNKGGYNVSKQGSTLVAVSTTEETKSFALNTRISYRSQAKRIQSLWTIYN